MHIRLLLNLCLLWLTCSVFTAGQAFGQDNYQMPKIDPARFSGPKNLSAQEFKPSEQADIQNRPALEVNQLRHEFGAPPSRQTQNSMLPPVSPLDDRKVAKPNPPMPSNNSGTRRLPPVNQEPANLLDPNRISDGLNPSNNSGLSPMGNLESKPIIDRNMPLVEQPSAMTTSRISDSISDGSRNVAATFASPEASTSKINEAKRIIEFFDVSSNNQPLPGVPVSLEDMMKTTPLKYRKAMVRQYWETYFDWATLQNRIRHSSWLQQVSNPRTRPEQLLLQTAKSIAKNDVTAAEIQLSKSQSKLQQLARSKTRDLLPLPLDQPLVTNYNSHYDWYEARDLIPANLKGINEMLPRTHKLISERAKTVAQAENARKLSLQAFSGGQVALGDLLMSGSVWKSSLQDFVGTVVTYNYAISDYALSITSPQKPIDQVVAMLVAKPKSINEVAQKNSILQRTGPQSPQQHRPTRRVASQPNFNRVNATGANAGSFRDAAANSARTQPQVNRNFGQPMQSQPGQALPPSRPATRQSAAPPANPKNNSLNAGRRQVPAENRPSVNPSQTGGNQPLNGAGGSFKPPG